MAIDGTKSLSKMLRLNQHRGPTFNFLFIFRPLSRMNDLRNSGA